jgi:hypothetical protein
MLTLLARVNHDFSSGRCICDLWHDWRVGTVSWSQAAQCRLRAPIQPRHRRRPCLEAAPFCCPEGGSTSHTTQVAAGWTLSDTVLERIEQIRDGEALTIYPTSRTH